MRIWLCEYAARSTLKLEKPARPKPLAQPGYIYVIQAGANGPVKIGWSIAPHGRIEYFQTGHYEKLRTILVFSGTAQDEHALHARFSDYRIRNEWFEPAVLEALPAKSTRWGLR